MSKRSKRNKKVKKIFRYTVLTVAVVMLIASALMFMRSWENNRGMYNKDGYAENYEVIHNGKVYTLKENIETFMVLGLDKFDDFKAEDSYNNDMQADFLMLFVFDHDAKKCTAVQISRDTMVDVNILGVSGNKIDTSFQQIALAHTYGDGGNVSCRNTADSVSSLLNGVRIEHYISLTMDCVKILNDTIGGVEVTVLDDFSGIDDTLVKGETVTLMGDRALLYIRARQGLDDSSNTGRMERQRQYMEAFYQKALKASDDNGDITFKTLTDISEYIVSDRTITQLSDLSDKFADYEFCGIKTINGDVLTGEKYMEFYADQQSVDDIVIELFYEEKAD